MKTILGKVDEMRKQRISLESQFRDLIHKDDITGVLVTTERAEIKVNNQLKQFKMNRQQSRVTRFRKDSTNDRQQLKNLMIYLFLSSASDIVCGAVKEI